MTIHKVQSKFPHWWTVKLLEGDWKWIQERGAERNQNGMNRCWTSKTGNNTNDWHIRGMAAEWAVSVALLSRINLTITSGSKRELNSGDISGMIEVKSNSFPDGSKWDLIVNEDHMNADRFYVNCLTHWLPNHVVIQGWRHGTEILSDHRIGNHGGTGHRVLIYDWKKLKDFDGLFDVVRGKVQKVPESYGTHIPSLCEAKMTYGRGVDSDKVCFVVVDSEGHQK